MPVLKEKQSNRSAKITAASSQVNDSLPDINEELFAMVVNSPFFKEKNRQAQEALSKMDLSQVFERSPK